MGLHPISIIHSFGDMCKITRNACNIYGRYVGKSNMYDDDDQILIICTPGNSLIHAKESMICFDMDPSDYQILWDFENIAKDNHEWYHTNRSKVELEMIGVFMPAGDIHTVDNS